MHQRPRLLPVPSGHQRRKGRDIAIGGKRLEPRRPRRAGGHRPDAIGRQVAPRDARGQLRHAVGGGEEQAAHAVQVHGARQRDDLDHRRGHRAEPARQRRFERRREFRRLRRGTGQEQGPALGHGRSLVRAARRCARQGNGVSCAPRGTQSRRSATLTGERIILGIESSCDDTAAAVIRACPGRTRGEILAADVMGQDALHVQFGGIVPEIAARAHAERLDLVTEAALSRAGLTLDAVDALAVTAGPGLIGGLLAGVMFAKGLAAGRGLPLYGVNHLAGHALTPRLVADIGFPYLMLLVSGGHCQYLAVTGPESFTRLGGTIDDAPGEAFDKIARHLGLGAPGGPALEAESRAGDPARFAFPRPLLDREGCDLSFSGLKTAVRRACDRLVETQGGITRADRADLCAGFQAAVTATLEEKTRRALRVFAARHGATTLAVAGGVAANRAIRAALETMATAEGFAWLAPPASLCTDNGAIIAWAAAERMAVRGPDALDLSARPRWPLDADAAPMLGSGRKGAKA